MMFKAGRITKIDTPDIETKKPREIFGRIATWFSRGAILTIAFFLFDMGIVPWLESVVNTRIKISPCDEIDPSKRVQVILIPLFALGGSA